MDVSKRRDREKTNILFGSTFYVFVLQGSCHMRRQDVRTYIHSMKQGNDKKIYEQSVSQCIRGFIHPGGAVSSEWWWSW